MKSTLIENVHIEIFSYINCHKLLRTCWSLLSHVIFYKEPLVAISSISPISDSGIFILRVLLVAISPDSEGIFDPACLASINIYKYSVKKHFLSLQSQGEDDKWPAFLLNNIANNSLDLRRLTEFSSQNVLEIIILKIFIPVQHGHIKPNSEINHENIIGLVARVNDKAGRISLSPHTFTMEIKLLSYTKTMYLQ